MARSRNIKPGFLEDEDLADLGPYHQIFAVASPMFADKAGRLEDRPRRLKASIFGYYDVDLEQILTDLAGMPEPYLKRYEVGGKRYIQLLRFAAEQNPHHKEVESTIPACPMLEPSMNEARVKQDNLGSQAPESGIRDQESSNQESGGGKPNRTDKKEFVAFWAAVHHRVGKRHAETAYGMAVKRIRIEQPDVDPHSYLLQRMEAFAKSPAARPTDHRVIHPTTWLEHGRYDDDPATWEEAQQSRVSTNGQAVYPGNLAVREHLLADEKNE